MKSKLKHLCVVFVLMSVMHGNAVGHVVPQRSPLQLKADINNNVELYRDSGNGSSWLQMLFVFARGSSNINQSASLIDDAPCSDSETIVCKVGFIPLESKKCYYFSNRKSSWHDALKVCQSMVTTLAYPLSAIENTAIVNHLNANLNGTQGWWLGGTDEAKEGEWAWTHNKALMIYADWLQHQPANSNNNEHCLQYWKSDDGQWKWNDRPCNDPYPFICQQ